MNSLILTALASFGRAFARCFKASGIYAVIDKIYTAFSRSWKNSRIVRAVGSDKRSGSAAKSVTGRILRLPFTFLEFIGSKTGGFLRKRIKTSVICRTAYEYTENFCAINTRFFGIMLLSMSVVYTAAHMVLKGGVSKAALAAAVFGTLISLVNYDLMRFLNPSKLAEFVKCAMGFRKLKFDFFDENAVKGVPRLVIAALVGAVSAAVMSVSPLYGAAIPFGIFGLLLVLSYPITGVFAAVFAAPFVPTMILAGLCIWTFLSLVLHSFFEENFKWRFDGMGVAVMLFLAVLLVSCLFSFARGSSLKVWLMYAVFAGFYFVIVNTVKTRDQAYALLKMFAISGALVALYGVMQYVFGWATADTWIDEEMFESNVTRVYSTLANPNVLGEYLLLVIPVTAIFALKDRWRRVSKWAYIAMFLVTVLCLVLTQSRGCWIGFILAAALFVTFYEGKWWAFFPFLLLLAPMFLPASVIERFASVGNMKDSSTSYRVYIWLGTIGLIKNFWLGGIGMGEDAFHHVYPFFMYNAVVAPHSHNTFLQMIVESGIGGLAVFIALSVVFFMKMHTLHTTGERKSRISTSALALSCGVAAFLAQSMFDYTFYNYRVMAVFFMVLAMGMALKSSVGEETE